MRTLISDFEMNERALEQELRAEGLEFAREVWIDVLYKEIKVRQPGGPAGPPGFVC